MKVVCFDLGGVLARIDLTLAGSAQRAGVAISAPCAAFPQLPAYFYQHQLGQIDDDAYLQHLSRDLNVSPEEARRVHQAILIEPYAGTLELVQDLNRAGYATACLSNTNSLHWQEMANAERWPAFAALQFPVGSHVIGLEKPTPESFQALMDIALPGGSPADVVFFDDGAGNVQGAAEFGWQAHLVDALGDPAAQMRAILAGLGAN